MSNWAGNDLTFAQTLAGQLSELVEANEALARNQAERDLRPSKCQQNISGRLTSEDRTRDRYTINFWVNVY